MQTKKIFFLADANSIHTVKWVDYFVEANYDVHLATFAKNNRTKCKNIYFWNLFKLFLFKINISLNPFVDSSDKNYLKSIFLT